MGREERRGRVAGTVGGDQLRLIPLVVFLVMGIVLVGILPDSSAQPLTREPLGTVALLRISPGQTKDHGSIIQLEKTFSVIRNRFTFPTLPFRNLRLS